MTSSEIDSLIYDISLGNEKAFESLYEETHNNIFALALSILREYYLAEDVMQEVYSRVLSSSKDYKAQNKGIAWMLKITRNLSYDILKKYKKNNYVDDFNIFPKDIENSDDPNEYLILKEAMSLLKMKEREILILYAVSGYSHKEISNILGMSYSTVRWYYNFTIKKLQKIIERRSYSE